MSMRRQLRISDAVPTAASVAFTLPVDALVRVDPYVRLRSMHEYLRGAHIGDFEFGPLVRRTVGFDSPRQGGK